MSSSKLSSQVMIQAEEGYSPHIGTTVSMLDDLKSRIEGIVTGMDVDQTDFLLDEDANRIGALIYHLAATEKYYQLYTFENREFEGDENDTFGRALSLGARARKELVGESIDYYLKIWDQVREETKRLLKTKDDTWFAQLTEAGSMNNHWAWYHVMEHQANHMGQIAMIVKRIPR